VPAGTGTDAIADDYAIIFRASNPFSPDKHLMLIAGSFGYGVWAGVRFVASEAFLDNELVKAGTAIECLIKTDIFRDTPQNIRSIALRELDCTA
jgi:hypothetical protein